MLKDNKNIAFFEKNSWYHRTKTLMPDNKIKYGKKGGFKTKEEAEESYYKYKTEFEKSLSKTIIKNKNEITIKEYLEYWYQNIYSTRIESTTKMLGAYVLYDLIFPNIDNDIKLRLISIEYLDDLLIRISKMCDSAGNKSRELLNIAFKDAVADKFILTNPVLGTKKYKRKKSKVIIFNTAELKKFLELASEENWYLEILLGVFLGLRKGEILALKFSDFDLNEKTVTISRQLSADAKVSSNTGKKEYKIENYTLKTKSPKTKNSYRILRVPNIILEELEIRKNYYNHIKESKNFCDLDFISCQSNGKPHSLSSLNTYINKICLKNNLPKISVHSLRHMFATILLEKGVSIVKISGLLGHNSIHTTFEFYCEIMDEKEKIKSFINQNFKI